jgi:DNA-binding response OmpR family regulator
MGHAFFAPCTFGELSVDQFEVRWRGQKVALRPLERVIVLRLLEIDGALMSWRCLAMHLGFNNFDESAYGNLRCYISRTRKRFYMVDASFRQLETIRGCFRWIS